MGSVVLVADETVAARRDVVYGLFGAGAGAGWVFAAECDTLAVGSVVTLQLPVGGGQAAVDIRQQLHPAEASAGGFRLLDRHTCAHLFIQLS